MEAKSLLPSIAVLCMYTEREGGRGEEGRDRGRERERGRGKGREREREGGREGGRE